VYQNFIILYLYETQHVSGDTPPIIRSLKLHWQPLVFHTWKVVGHVVGGRCQAHTVPDNVRYTGRPLTQSDYTRSCINTIVLLRTSTELLETCRGFKWTYRRNCASSWSTTRIMDSCNHTEHYRTERYCLTYSMEQRSFLRS